MDKITDNAYNIVIIAVLCIAIFTTYFRLIKGHDYFENYTNNKQNSCPQKRLNSIKHTKCGVKTNLPNSRLYYGPVITTPIKSSCSKYIINPHNLDKQYRVRDVCHGMDDPSCRDFRNISLDLHKHYLGGMSKFNPNYNLFG